MTKQIIEAWKLTDRNPDPTSSFNHFWIVRYDDGTGNMVNPDGQRLFRDTTPFAAEPEAYLYDTPYYRIHPVQVSTVPGAES